jgi:hypothetical protein
MKNVKPLDVFLLCLKILLPILILIPLVFFTYRLTEGRMSDIANAGNDDYHSGLGLYIFASHMLLFIANVILAVIGAIGLLIATKYKTCPIQRKNIIAFRCLAIAPLCSQMLYVLINMIVMSIG